MESVVAADNPDPVTIEIRMKKITTVLFAFEPVGQNLLDVHVPREILAEDAGLGSHAAYPLAELAEGTVTEHARLGHGPAVITRR